MPPVATQVVPLPRFAVALTYCNFGASADGLPPPHPVVDPLAHALAERLTQDRVLYDRFHVAEFARPGLDIWLPELYRKESELIVVFLAKGYAGTLWTGLEWRQVYAVLARRPDSIMLVRIDSVDVENIPGLTDGDGCVEARDYDTGGMVDLVLRRLSQLRGEHQPAVPTLPSPPEPAYKPDRLSPTMGEFVAWGVRAALGPRPRWLLAALVLALMIVVAGRSDTLLTSVGVPRLGPAPRIVATLIPIQAVLTAFMFWRALAWARGAPPRALTRDEVERTTQSVDRQCEREFLFGWTTITFGWCVLYSVLTVQQYLPPIPSVVTSARIVATWGNNLANVGMLVCYWVMAFATSGEEGAPRSDARRLGWALIAVSLWFALCEYVATEFCVNDGQASSAFDTASGLASGVVFALWLARLDSKLIDTSVVVTALLFSYVAIQPLWPAVAGNSLMAGVLLAVALFGKALLWLQVAWILGTGRLLFYFSSARSGSRWTVGEWARRSGTPPPGGLALPPADGFVLAPSVLAPVLMLGAAWYLDRVPESALVGRWSADISWKSNDYFYNSMGIDSTPSTPARSVGELVFTEQGGLVSGISRWTFIGQDGDTDPDRAVLVVRPDVTRDGDGLRVALTTLYRLRCPVTPENAVRTSGEAIGQTCTEVTATRARTYYWELQELADRDTLECDMRLEGYNDSLGTVTLRRDPSGS